MNILAISILIIMLFISILALVYHFSRVFSDEGFPENIPIVPSFYLPMFMIFSLLTPISEKIVIKHNNSIFIFAILLHLAAFMTTYSVILLIIPIIQLIQPKISIFPSNHIIYSKKLKKNTKILKLAFLISYFLSALIFIFIIKNFIITIFSNSGIDISLLKEEFKAYYELFILSFVPILYSYLKNKKS